MDGWLGGEEAKIYMPAVRQAGGENRKAGRYASRHEGQWASRKEWWKEGN